MEIGYKNYISSGGMAIIKIEFSFNWYGEVNNSLLNNNQHLIIADFTLTN